MQVWFVLYSICLSWW